MYTKLIKNDIRRSKLITITIAAFITVAAALTALAASLTVNLLGAINNMMQTAKTVDFMQMHTGDVDMNQIQSFVETNDSVEDVQVLPFLNIEGAEIIIGGESLEWSMQDNGFTVQGERFDFLLDLNNEIIQPSDGEIYIPVYYMQEGAAQLGDTVTVHGVKFTVAGFMRDSTMNQALVSSKRFLVNRSGYEQLLPFGMPEHLIEFRLKDGVSAADFEAAYLNEGLPSNGPPSVTKMQVQLMNGMTDGIMIAVLALIVILVTIVAFLCIRFTLLAKIEEDYREIGVLKAVGLRNGAIKKLYLAKYGAIAGCSSALGFLLSVSLSNPFMNSIRLYMGDGGAFLPGLLWGLAGSAVIFGVVLLYVRKVLRRFRKISAAQAIRYGAPREKSKSSRTFKLSNRRLLSRNVFLGIKDILSRKKLYVTMLTVLIISAFIMIVPQNIYNTISSKSFSKNMGMGVSDASIYISSTQTEDVTQKSAETAAALASDPDVEIYNVTTAVMLDMKADNGVTQRLRVNLGDHTVFPINYSRGAPPLGTSEIALSTLNADDLEKQVGDEIVLMIGGAEKTLTVCGIYSDITSGGRTAQAVFGESGGDLLSVSATVTFRDGADIPAIISRYKERFPFAKVYGMEENIRQTMGSMMDAINLASYVAMGVSALLTLLVTLLFMKMLVTKDRTSIAVLKSTGFTVRDIRRQYITRAFVVLVMGVVIGTILANTLGEFAGIVIVSSFGASAFSFTVNPWFAYLFAPLLIAACVYTATRLGVSGIRSLKISDHIKEA